MYSGNEEAEIRAGAILSVCFNTLFMSANPKNLMIKIDIIYPQNILFFYVELQAAMLLKSLLIRQSIS